MRNKNHVDDRHQYFRLGAVVEQIGVLLANGKGVAMEVDVVICIDLLTPIIHPRN